MNIPTMLTVLRILIIPIVVLCYYLPYPWAHPATAVLFAFACLTDWLDGYLARAWGQMTALGAFLDPVADKLLVATALVLVLREHPGAFLPIATAIIVGREIVISALREWMAEMGKRASVAVSFIGKLKTTMQMIALTLLLWYVPASAKWVEWSGSILLYIAAGLTLWSMLVYLRIAWRDLKGSQAV